MNTPIELSEMPSGTNDQRIGLFAVLCLGVTDCLSSGTVSVAESIELFFNARNCHYVRKQLADKRADEAMGRGVQLPDLFDALPEQQAQQEFQRELQEIRSLCLQLLSHNQMVA
jgi:hypothetical protein